MSRFLNLSEHAAFFPESDSFSPNRVVERYHDSCAGKSTYASPVAVGRICLSDAHERVLCQFTNDQDYMTRVHENGRIDPELPEEVQQALGAFSTAAKLIAQHDAKRAGLTLDRSRVLAGYFDASDYEPWHIDGENGLPGVRWTVTKGVVRPTLHAQGISSRNQTNGTQLFYLKPEYEPGRNPELTVVEFEPGTVVRHELACSFHKSAEGEGSRALAIMTTELRLSPNYPK